MSRLNNIINDLKNLENQEVGKQTYFHKIYTNNAGLNEISTLEILKNLEQYEIEKFEIINYLDEYEEKILEVSFEEFCEVEEYEEIRSNNSYNWLAPVTNHFNYKIYKSNLYEGIIVELKVHRYGDVRCNYTEEAYFEFNTEYEFYEVLAENNKIFTIKKDNIEYDVTIDIFNECPNIEKNIEEEYEYIEGYEAFELLEELLKED